jgi:hypothetical protein
MSFGKILGISIGNIGIIGSPGISAPVIVKITQICMSSTT